MIEELWVSLHFSESRTSPALDRTLKFLLVLIQRDFIRLAKFSVESIVKQFHLAYSTAVTIIPIISTHKLYLCSKLKSMSRNVYELQKCHS